MILVDALAAAYVAYGVMRGRKRGLPDEAYRLLRFGTAFAAGCGLYGLVSDIIGKILSLAGDVAAPLAFVGTVGGAWWLLRVVKQSFLAWSSARFAPFIQTGGAVAGGLRTALVVLSIVATFSMAERAPGHAAVSRETWVGRIAGWVMPGR